MGLASNQYFLAVTRELLTSKRFETPHELFKRSGIPKTPGYRAITFYEYHGAIRISPKIEADPRRILALQGGLRADQAVPDRDTIRGPSLDVALEALANAGISAAIGFQTAANRHAYFEPSGSHQLYIDRPSATDARVVAALAHAVIDEHPNSSPSEGYELHVEDFGRLELGRDRGLPITSPVQTLLDLCLHSRMAAHKEFLLDQLQKQEVLRA